MSLTKEQLEHLAKLCAIKLTDEEKDKFVGQIDEIVEFVGQLQEVDVDGIEPLSHPLEDKFLQPRSGVVEYEDQKGLFQNTKHPIKNHGVVIKSPIKG